MANRVAKLESAAAVASVRYHVILPWSPEPDIREGDTVLRVRFVKAKDGGPDDDET
jgi:hypothetical protein